MMYTVQRRPAVARLLSRTPFQAAVITSIGVERPSRERVPALLRVREIRAAEAFHKEVHP